MAFDVAPTYEFPQGTVDFQTLSPIIAKLYRDLTAHQHYLLKRHGESPAEWSRGNGRR